MVVTVQMTAVLPANQEAFFSEQSDKDSTKKQKGKIGIYNKITV